MRGNTVRKQVFIYSGVVLVLAAAVAVWFFLTQENVDRLFAASDRVNVLLAGHHDDGTVDLLTLVSFSEADVVLFSFPTNVRLRARDGAFVRAADLGQQEGIPSVSDGISAMIGMQIPFYLSFDYSALRMWIESLGGVNVTLSGDAIYRDDSIDPALRTEIRAGVHPFDADSAILLATSPSEEGDLGRLARQQALLQALLSQGIQQQTLRAVRKGIDDLDPPLESNLSLSELALCGQLLHAIEPGAIRANRLAGEIVEIEGVSYTQPNVVETERIVAALLKGLELLTPSDVQVAVFNGNGIRLMARRTADYLKARGFAVTGIGNADAFDYDTSYVIVLTDEAKAWVLRDALPSDAKIVFPDTFRSRYEALQDYIPAGTDIVFIAGAGLEIE